MKITLGDLLEKDIDSAFIKRYKNLGFEEIDWGNVKKIVINDEIIHEFLYDVISKFKISNIELLYDSVCDNLLVLDRWNNNSNLIYGNLKAKEVLKLLQITRPTLCKYVKEGWIKTEKLKNNQYWYDEKSVQEFFNKKIDRSVVIYARVSTQKQKKRFGKSN